MIDICYMRIDRYKLIRRTKYHPIVSHITIDIHIVVLYDFDTYLCSPGLMKLEEEKLEIHRE
jgi:hypothetical protein